MVFQCRACKSNFTRERNLKKHFAEKHSGSNIVLTCFLCGQIFNTAKLLNDHHKSYHKPSKYFEIKETAFKQTAITYRYVYDPNKIMTVIESLDNFIKSEIKKILYYEAAKKNYIKCSIIFIAQMIMYDADNQIVTRVSIPFRSHTFNAQPNDKKNIKKNIKKCFGEHTNLVDSFINNGSNWVFDRPMAIDVEIVGIKPISAGSSNCKINIEILKNNKFLKNIPSKNEQCFLYCLVEGLFGDQIKNKISIKKYEKYISKFDINNIDFPISIKHIKKFIHQNTKFDIKLNLLFTSKGKIFPLECGIGNGSKQINLLMVHTENSSNQAKAHFLYITNLDKFLRQTYKDVSDSGKLSYKKSFFCPNCLNEFSIFKNREKHLERCISNNSCIERTPDFNNNKIFFTKYQNQYPCDLVGYLDFECELPKTFKDICEICKTLRCKCNESYTRFETEQKPICFSFLILNKENKIIYKKTYSGNDAGKYFIEDLLNQEQIWIKKYLNKSVDMFELSEDELMIYNSSEKCYMCRKRFSDDDPKVRDHSHSDGTFIGSAHRSCNLKRRREKTVKIFMHNASKYDNHFIIKSLIKQKVKNLYILPFNMENFKMIKFNSFVFLDSIAFLQNSLSQLANELKDSNHDYPIIKQSSIVKTNGKFDQEKFDMVLGKSFFPYEFW